LRLLEVCEPAPVSQPAKVARIKVAISKGSESFLVTENIQFARGKITYQNS
jgi:hypothetical protein